MSTCTCGTLSRAHKTDCPMSSRNRYPSCTLFPKVSCDESHTDDKSDDSTLPKVNEHLAGSTQLGKRDRLAIDETPSVKKSKPDFPSFKVGDHVCVHNSKLDKHYIPCRVVQVVNNVCRLYCCKGVLKRGFCSSELKALSSDWSISLENWLTAARVSLGKVSGDSECLEVCKCSLPKPVRTVVILTKDSQDAPSGAGSPAGGNWLHNALYSLTLVNREEVLSPSGWLSDSVIAAAQLIILQEFPHLSGLQDPVLQQNLSFQVHRGEFVQIIHVRNNHWCTVSNVGCNEGVVNVYDSLYPSVSKSTLKLIASLMFSSASKLVVRMVDVGRQYNGSDCGVLAIAFAYDICSGNDPCKVDFENRSIRQHLASCLEQCHLSRFPVAGERRCTGVRHTQSVDLHCSCRLPDEKGDKMAECDVCKTWYHQHCMDIPGEVFGDSEVPWKCKRCSNP